MKAELKSSEHFIDYDEITVWELHTPVGAVININKLFDDSVAECSWIDDDHKYLRVDYYDWDSNELTALVDSEGDIIRKGILNVEEYLPEHGLFIVEMSGFGMGDRARDFDLEDDDSKMAVINRFGDFVIKPEYRSIIFEPEENLFYAGSGYSGYDYAFSLEGKRTRIKEE
jgi:hypothetical protein